MRYMRSFCLQPSALTTSESADFENPALNWLDACDMRSSTRMFSQVGPLDGSPCGGGVPGPLLTTGGCEASEPPGPAVRSTHLDATAATTLATAGVLDPLTCSCRRLTPAQSLLLTRACALCRFSSTALVSAARNASLDAEK